MSARAVLFDLDGTLVDSLPSIVGAANALLADLGAEPITDALGASFVGWGERVFLEKLIAARGLSADAEALRQPYLTHYEDLARETRAIPGTREALDSLKVDGVLLGLVTNKPRAPLGPSLVAAGLDGLFDIVIAGDDLPKRKPDPAPLRHAMAELGVERAIYVGDSPVDSEAAARAGLPFLLYTEGIVGVPEGAVACTASFNDYRYLRGILQVI
ncbi:MAG: HAD-IA family hydrolase [Pseudomonadota bacterium]